MKIEVLSIFYGEKYTRLFFETCLPTLGPNLIQIQKEGVEILHRVHCPKDEAVLLEAYAAIADWPVEIVTNGFTGDPHHDRHNAIHPCYQEALRREVLTVCAPADHIFGKGLWGVIHDLQPGQYIVCGHPRIAFPDGLARARDFINAGGHGQDNRDLVRLCLEEIPHPMVDYGKHHPDPYWRTALHDQPEKHYETFFCSPPPLAFIGSADMLLAWSNRTLFGPLEVIDHDLVNHCHRYSKLKAVTDSREFFWAEWTDGDRYRHSNGSEIRTIYQLESMRHFNGVPLRWYV
jgi:hypothetical protein